MHTHGESVLGISGNTFSEGFLHFGKRVVKLKTERFGISYRNKNFPAIVAIFSWKRRKGKSACALHQTQGHPNYERVCWAAPSSLSCCGEVTFDSCYLLVVTPLAKGMIDGWMDVWML